MSGSAKKTKGKSLENDIASYIHKFIYENIKEYKDLFDLVGNDAIKPKRDASSGTFSDSDGDINLGIAKKFFPFSVECKNWDSLTDLNINILLKGKSPVFKIWSQQILPASNRTGMKPLLVFKGKRTIDFCMYSLKSLDNKLPKNYFKFNDFVICNFEDFMPLFFNINLENVNKEKEIEIDL